MLDTENYECAGLKYANGTTKISRRLIIVGSVCRASERASETPAT